MKNIFKKITKYRFLSIILLFGFLLLVTMCVTIPSVNQPTSATVGETISITVDVNVAPAEDASHNVVFGVLVPVSWNVASNASATFTSDNGNGTFSLDTGTHADTFEAVLGIGENYGEVEWVAFVSNEQVTGVNGVGFSGQVQLTLTVGNENINTQLGYAAAASGYVSAGDIGSFFTPCMEVSGGANPLIDLCGPLPYPVTYEPISFTVKDIIKINFDASKGDTGLFGASQVYFCGKAMVDGVAVENCGTAAINTMANLGNDLWDITIWPNSFFSVSPSAVITDMSFTFRNTAGDIVIQDPNTNEDFLLTDNCE
ncbi:DUF4961 domain-containing protein [Changchengzhania lutea]|uniref:DUF4961 domain-containing protein n=1 Tax=Changchengzhania lutea TaxID=2049305 RepID=UPI00115C8AE2|nr:DUF4961 domain-containing protein [Changchengzhania lutea]